MSPRQSLIALASLWLGLAASAQEAVGAGGTGDFAPGVAPVPGGADCDGSGTLDALDFLCFQNLFAAGNPGADCDGSGTLDLFDYLCFYNAFAGGFASPQVARAEPDWMGKTAPGQWCVTHERYIAGLFDQGVDPVTVICAEVGPCDNPADRNASIPTLDTPIKTYRLSIHVFCDDNGGNCAATPADVPAAVARLNADYAPWRIQFVYEANFINSTKYRTFDSGDEWFMKKTYADSPATKLNVYVIDTGSGASWGTFPWDPNALDKQGGIVIAGGGIFNGAYSIPILTHEVGHCLGLYHTHHGVDEVPQCGDCYEAAGRSPEDGDIIGDRCADTNPTPSTNRNCFDPPGTDACSGNPWLDTPYLNYMGYAYQCESEFTAQQAGRMHCWAGDRLSGWLQVPMPPAAPGTPALTKLGGGQVRAAWADNSNNEDGFRVQRETKSGANWVNTQIVATVGPNTASATDTPGTGTFRYRILAFNGVGDSAWSGWTQIKN